ncbi:TetR/AcrR family transcriptional regulator [Blastococcus goldschmidtiae]|uniref:TetR/AcrR family transcriptional regulator n=1 Tax=Blastococcus goldschmidtiae TaxID=3075546 RepID=A0ABU2K806_9ACTN|nr:TetR/AcrR family transcriptional regulator [Blastococcus sp. DSM 46792]MDT0276327.1 TetR/AcrR family transcriptional regulator [Blastococcus sp. DSM 46792]
MSVLSAPDVRPSRGGRPRDPSRDGVIRAAILRLLADVGYGALTMDAVAAEAGVGKATIYRRWRTKEELVVDTVSDLNAEQASTPDTGSLEGDLRQLLRSMVALVNGPAGAAIQALLSSMQHQPALAAAFRAGPLAAWQTAFRETWARAEQRGDLPAGLVGTPVTDAIGAPLVQRWLASGQPVDDAYADAVLDMVALPLLRAHGATV